MVVYNHIKLQMIKAKVAASSKDEEKGGGKAAGSMENGMNSER